MGESAPWWVALIAGAVIYFLAQIHEKLKAILFILNSRQGRDFNSRD